MLEKQLGRVGFESAPSEKQECTTFTKQPAHRKRTELNIRFRVRSGQKDSPQQTVNLQIRLTLNGETISDYASGIKVPAAKWDNRTQRVLGKHPLIAETNERIAAVELQHREILRELKRRYQQSEGPLPTAKLIKQEYLNPGSTDLTLDAYYTRFLNFIESQVGAEDGFSPKTLARYHLTYRYVREFLAINPEKNLKIAGVTAGWGRRFHAWLQVDTCGIHRMRKGSANYYLACVRKALDFAQEEGYLRANPLDKFRPKRGKGKPVYFLEPVHIDRLMGLRLSGSMSVTLWWAKLMCLTGMDYCDAVRYARDRAMFHQEAPSGQIKIVIERSKPPRNYCEILLLPEVKALFDEHPNGPYAPVLADINRNLKVIQDALEFPLTLTTKICRKTAGVHFLRLGFQLATVSKMLGHSSIRTTESHYVRVVSSQVDQDIERVVRNGEATPIRPVVSSQPFFRVA